MKNNHPSRRGSGTSLTVIALCCAMFLGGLTPALAKDKKHKDGYWDPYGHFHRYSDEKNAKNGYWDPYGNYHRYNDNNGYWDPNGHYHRYNDDRKVPDYISQGKQIWNALFK